jgi:hypothetical protein
VQLDERLRGPALANDASAWRWAWQSLDAAAIAPLLATAARGEPARLTLCGERSAVEFAPRRRAWWQRMIDTVAAPRANARALLESL